MSRIPLSTGPKSPDRCTVVICTHGIHDPLVSTLMLDYLLRMGPWPGRHRVLLFTEEPGPVADREQVTTHLISQGIEWVPLRYDPGRPQWRQRIRNIWKMYQVARRAVRNSHRKQVVGFLSFGGGYAMVMGMLGIGSATVVCFEPHSRYMIDLGIWSAGGLKARVVGAMEAWQMRRAKDIVVPTVAVQRLVERVRGNARGVRLQGVTIDVWCNSFRAQDRDRLRDEFGLSGYLVPVYVGKFGGLYHSPGQYLEFIQRMCSADDLVRGVIIAGAADLKALRDHPSYKDLAGKLVLLPAVPPADLPRYLSACDIGVLAIPPTPTQVYRTPVKTAYYWAAGLPVLTPEGIGDDADVVRATRTGIVVEDLPLVDAHKVLSAYRELCAEGLGELRQRCMSTAMAYRDSGSMVRILEELLV